MAEEAAAATEGLGAAGGLPASFQRTPLSGPKMSPQLWSKSKLSIPASLPAPVLWSQAQVL